MAATARLEKTRNREAWPTSTSFRGMCSPQSTVVWTPTIYLRGVCRSSGILVIQKLLLVDTGSVRCLDCISFFSPTTITLGLAAEIGAVAAQSGL